MTTPTLRPPGPGLTAAGAVVVAVGLGLLGAVIDVVTGPGLRTVFSVLFVIGCGLAAFLARRAALLATVVMPPLVYLLVILIAAGFEAVGTSSSWLNQQILEAGTSLVIHAPTLIVATLAAAVIAGFRAAGNRHTAAPRRPSVPQTLR